MPSTPDMAAGRKMRDFETASNTRQRGARMSHIRSYLTTIAIVAVAILAGARTARAQAEAKIDVTGKWLFNVTTSAGSGAPTVTLKQQGDSLTGHYSSQTLGEADLKGTVKDRKITFSFNANVDGTSFVVTYSGSIESNDALKGSVDLAGQATGTFTAKRQ